jgi:hypothetical protein
MILASHTGRGWIEGRQFPSTKVLGYFLPSLTGRVIGEVSASRLLLAN